MNILKEKAAQKLIEGIGRYGLENVSVLSKYAEIPVETARYMIWEELPKHKVSVKLSVNLPRIGLGRWMLQLTPVQKSHIEAMDTFLKNSGGVLYLSRILPENASLSLLGIPFGEQYKLREQLVHLKTSNMLESYSLDEVEWMRDVSFIPSMYDFKERDWSFRWDDLDKNREPASIQEIKEDPAQLIDYKDILILKELQKSIPRTLSKLSKPIGLDQHNLRYHFKSHVRSAISGYYLKINPKNPELYATFLFSHTFQNERSIADARTVSLRIPFTQKVWKTERNYCWLSQCPGEYTGGLLRYVNDKFIKIPGKLTVSYIDTASEHSGTISHSLFDQDKGVWKYEPKSSIQMIKK